MQRSVRRAVSEDWKTVVDFNCRLAEESEGKKLDAALITPGVQAALADPHKGYYFFAQEGEETLGQMGVTFEWSDWRNGWFWWIQSVYVRAEIRRQGVFRMLFDHVLQTAKNDPNVIGLRLYVENDNQDAQETYLRHEMKWTGYKVMEMYPFKNA